MKKRQISFLLYCDNRCHDENKDDDGDDVNGCNDVKMMNAMLMRIMIKVIKSELC